MFVAIAQLSSQDRWEANLSLIPGLCEAAARRKADLILFPENSLYLGAPNRLLDVATYIAPLFPRLIQEIARDLRLAILIGSYPENRKGSRKVFNTSLLISEEGEILGRYRKIHLFDVRTPNGERYTESKFVSAGNSPVVIPWRGTRLGMSVCYDVRFPDHYQRLRKLGAEVLLVPSAFTTETGKAHWHALLRARAIENLAYAIAPAQTGRHRANRRTFGHSLVVDPWGKIILDAGTRPGLSFASIDPSKCRKLRRRFG